MIPVNGSITISCKKKHGKHAGLLHDYIADMVSNDTTNNLYSFIKSKSTDSFYIPYVLYNILKSISHEKAKNCSQQFSSVLMQENSTLVPDLEVSPHPAVLGITTAVAGV